MGNESRWNQLKFVTGNSNKVREASKILGCRLEQVSTLMIHEIQTHDINKIVEHKARQAYEELHPERGHPLLKRCLRLRDRSADGGRHPGHRSVSFHHMSISATTLEDPNQRGCRAESGQLKKRWILVLVPDVRDN